MRRWETIDVTDALELLSPLFESEEASAYFLKALLLLFFLSSPLVIPFFFFLGNGALGTCICCKCTRKSR